MLDRLETTDTAKAPGRLAKARAFLADKVVEVLMIFVGLYAAIAVQGRVDDAKERDTYADTLRNFAAEVKFNRDKRATDNFQAVQQGTTDFQAFDDYLVALAAVATEHPKAEQVDDLWKELAKLDSTFDADAANPELKLHALFRQFEEIKPIKLAPYYRRELYRAYLSGGVTIAQKNAKDRDLTQNLGLLYSELDVIERRVTEIEDAYNAKFLPRSSRIGLAAGRLWDYIEDADPEKNKAKIRADYDGFLDAARHLESELAEGRVETVVLCKQLAMRMAEVERLQQDLDARMDALLAPADKPGSIAAELAAVK